MYTEGHELSPHDTASAENEKTPTTKEPWQMSEEEFNESAQRGRFHMDEAEDVREVAQGRKPVAIIAYPERGDLAGQMALHDPKIAKEVEHRLFTYPGSTRTVAIVVRKGEDPDRSVDWYINFFYEKDENGQLRPKRTHTTPLHEIEFGKFLGYSIDDINCYLRENFGYQAILDDAREAGFH